MQKQRRQRFAHRGLAHRQLMTAFVQAFAGCIHAERDKIVVNPRHDPQIGVGRDRHTQFFAQRGFNALRRRPGMIDF